MATENVSFRESTTMKKQNQATAAYSYSNIVSKKPMVSLPKSSPPQSHPISPPTAVSSNRPYHHYIKKARTRSPTLVSKHFNLPTQKYFSYPNGSYLKYASECHNNNDNSNQNADFSWVSTLTSNDTQSLINNPLSSQTATSLHYIIESSRITLLVILNVPIVTSPRNFTINISITLIIIS